MYFGSNFYYFLFCYWLGGFVCSLRCNVRLCLSEIFLLSSGRPVKLETSILVPLLLHPPNFDNVKLSFSFVSLYLLTSFIFFFDLIVTCCLIFTFLGFFQCCSCGQFPDLYCSGWKIWLVWFNLLKLLDQSSSPAYGLALRIFCVQVRRMYTVLF